jgi:type 1 glutamine amidotransferase
MSTAAILTGLGRYADPWHPMEDTSMRIAEILREQEITAQVIPDVDRVLASWADPAVHLPDLVIANIGRWESEVPDDGADAAAVRAGLDRALDQVPVLALHCAANAFAAYDEYERAIGGRWIPGTSWHPERGTAQETRVGDAGGAPSDLLDGPETFTLHDERYLDLRQGPDNHVVYTHPDEEGRPSPSVWVRDTSPRRAYDALGHDARSYDSAEHRDLVGRLAHWLLAD